MSAEAIWYGSYVDGRPPKCRRLSRLPHSQQVGIAFSLALARQRGEAECRPTWLSLTGETYWYWPGLERPATKSGGSTPWWMLPPRTVRLANQVLAWATARAARQSPPVDPYGRDALPPSLRVSPRSPRAGHDHGAIVEMELRRIERQATRPARARMASGALEWRKRTPREDRVREWLRPDRAALAGAAWLRSVRAEASERYERGVPAMVYLEHPAARDVPERRSYAGTGTPPATGRLRRRSLPELLAAVDDGLRRGERAYRIAARLGVTPQRLASLDWLARVYGHRLPT